MIDIWVTAALVVIALAVGFFLGQRVLMDRTLKIINDSIIEAEQRYEQRCLDIARKEW